MRRSVPRASPQSSGKLLTKFNESVWADVCYVYFADGKQWKVTHFVDGFCSLSQGGATQVLSSTFAAETFVRVWLQPYGPPQILGIDRGPESKCRFEEVCKLAGVYCEVLPPNCKWRAGPGWQNDTAQF